MSIILFANNANTTLAGSITSVALTANLSPGSGVLFPAPTGGNYFVMTFVDAATGLLNEIVHVTNVTGDTITMVRAQEGTTALNWSAGDIAAEFVTAGQMQNLVQIAQLQGNTYNAANDTGTANSYVIAPTPAIAAYAAYQTFTFKAANANTGASTLTVSGLTAKSIKRLDGSNLAAGDITANSENTVIYDGTNFQLLSVRQVSPFNVQSQTYTYAADSGAANAYVIAPSPAITAYAVGQRFSFKAVNANTGASTLNVNSLGTVSIRRRDGGVLVAGDIVAGSICDVEYDGTNFQLLSGVQAPQVQVNTFSAFTDTGAANAYVITPYPVIAAYAAKQRWQITIGAGNTNTAGNPTPTVAISGLTARSIVKQSGAPFVGGELVAGTSYDFVDNGTALVLQGATGRTRLSANLNLYVSSSGTDSLGRGLVIGSPFATQQYAYDFVAKYIDLNGFTFQILVADGTYTGGIAAAGQLVGATSLTPCTVGASGTASNVNINITNGYAYGVSNGAGLLVGGFNISATGTTGTNGCAFVNFGGGTIFFAGTNFGACGNAAIYSSGSAGVVSNYLASTYTISGNMPQFVRLIFGGQANISGALVLSGSRAFSSNFATVSVNSVLLAEGFSFTGTATGSRFNINGNATIYTNGGAEATYFPGNASGTKTNNGVWL